MEKQSLLRLPAVKARTGQSRSAIYAAIQRGEFPKPVPIGARAVAWVESEIDDYIERQIQRRGAA
ncbi:MAG: AlpA family transcriptional regulator [Salinisphaera sp.]|uniref:helix-turn-helix transcriptional regulator n=1 Tax=Salinisphaera sp. TaxID=1914330 RepID=UPI003C7E09EB